MKTAVCYCHQSFLNLSFISPTDWVFFFSWRGEWCSDRFRSLYDQEYDTGYSQKSHSTPCVSFMERKNQARMHLMNADCGGEKIEWVLREWRSSHWKTASPASASNLLNKSNQPCEVSTSWKCRLQLKPTRSLANGKTRVLNERKRLQSWIVVVTIYFYVKWFFKF